MRWDFAVCSEVVIEGCDRTTSTGGICDNNVCSERAFGLRVGNMKETVCETIGGDTMFDEYGTRYVLSAVEVMIDE